MTGIWTWLMTDYTKECPEKLSTMMWWNPSHNGPYHHFPFFPSVIFWQQIFLFSYMKTFSKRLNQFYVLSASLPLTGFLIWRPFHKYTLSHFTTYNKFMMPHHLTQSLPKHTMEKGKQSLPTTDSNLHQDTNDSQHNVFHTIWIQSIWNI